MNETWVEEVIDAHGVELHVRRIGTAGPLLIAAHGITDSGACWSRIGQALSDTYQVVTYDARGHGASSRTTTYAFNEHVQDLLMLLDILAFESPILVGHSMGGSHVTAAAAAQPSLARAVVLEDPHWPMGREDPEIYKLDAWAARIREASRAPLASLIEMGRQDNPTWHDQDLLPWAKAQHQVDPTVVSWLRSDREIARWPELLRQVRCPVLVITGDRDVSVTPEVATLAEDVCPDLRVATIRGAGHSVRRDRFHPFMRHLRQFLKGIA